jgi:heme oxygenase (biliverdin-IX-beta and delta-forming)
MLLATALDDPIGVETVRSSGLRGRLKDATAVDHRELDARFAAFDLISPSGYRRFLEASAAALLPLEAALEQAGVAGIFADWAQRSRRAAIIADVGKLGGAIRPMPDVGPFSRHGLFGALYVLEGSRFGAKFLLRMIARSADPQISQATAYLRHGAGQALWPSFLARLESEAIIPTDESEAIAGARRAFALFAEAAVLA